MQASMGLYEPLANHPQKNLCKKRTLHYHDLYIGHIQFNFPFPYKLYTTATILLYKYPDTNMDITTTILPQVHINIKNSLVFPILSKLFLFLPLLWVQFFV